MNCLTKEELVAFGLNPLAADSAQTALHIYGCDACAKAFRDVVEVMACPAVKVSSAELNAAITALNDAHRRASLFTRLEATIGRFCEKIKTAADKVVNGIRSVEISVAPVFAPDFSYASGSTEESVHFTFAANLGATPSEYWTARIVIPLTPTGDRNIKIRCRDSKKQNVGQGTLHIFGAQLPVTNGLCTIDCEAMRANLRSTEVCFEFANGRKVRGHLIFD